MGKRHVINSDAEWNYKNIPGPKLRVIVTENCIDLQSEQKKKCFFIASEMKERKEEAAMEEAIFFFFF